MIGLPTAPREPLEAVTAIPQHIRALESYAHRRGVRLQRVALPDWLQGRQAEDHIVLRSGLAPEQELRVLVHELTHWLVHRERQLPIQRTIFEYEAEVVETLVMERLGLPADASASTALLAHSVRRVAWASAQLYDALGLSGSEAQSTVDVDATAGEEVVLEDEQHGVRNFGGLAEPA
jgi:hypothetical protein